MVVTPMLLLDGALGRMRFVVSLLVLSAFSSCSPCIKIVWIYEHWLGLGHLFKPISLSNPFELRIRICTIVCSEVRT